MNNLILPPAPSWFDSCKLSCATDNTLLFTARRNLVIIHPASLDKPAKIDIMVAVHHNIKSLMPNPNWNNPDKLALTASDDKLVVLWDIKTLAKRSSNNAHTTQLDNITGAVFAGNERVISVSEKGFIVVWKYNSQEINGIKDLLGNKVHVTCISSCVHASWLAAFGLKNGLIILADLRKSGKVLYKLRAHNASILSFSWCPVPVNVLKGIKPEKEMPTPLNEDKAGSSSEETFSDEMMNPEKYEEESVETSITANGHEMTSSNEEVLSNDDAQKNSEIECDIESTNDIEYLLASAAMDGVIYIWRAGTDGQIQKTLRMGKRQHKEQKLWMTLCWIKSSILLSSSISAELLQWNLLEKQEILKPIIVHNYHEMHLFSIAAPIIPCQSIEDEKSHNHGVWTYGKEGYLLNTTIFDKKETLISYPTVGALVFSIASSPIDPTRLALALGNGTIKVWDLSKEHLQHITMTVINTKIQCKVTCLDFHPSQECTLAFATSEGRVGTVNILNPNKPPLLLPQMFHFPIYKIQWLPSPNDSKNYNLFVCAHGKIVVYDVSKLLEKQNVLEFKEYITEFAWKTDLKVLVVGTQMGTLTLYSNELKPLGNLYLQKKPISKLVWHPEVESSNADEAGMKYNNWLALYTNEAVVYVYEISGFSKSDDDLQATLIDKFASSARLLKTVCWSPHESGVLALAEDDGFIAVWRVKPKCHISAYVNPNFVAASSMIWSPLNKDYMITAHLDQSIRIWNLNENQEVDKSILMKERKSLVNSKDKQIAATKNVSNVISCENDKPAKKWNTLIKSTKCMQNGANSVKAIKTLLKQNLERNTEFEKDEDSLAYLKLFGDKSDVIDLINLEQTTNHIANQHLSLWKGDINEQIKDAINRETVTPWLINMAPMVSPKLWLEACESYAKTLALKEDNDPYETASYFLVCHKIEEAIEVLCTAHLYNDALVIAKCRLSSTDPIINEILHKWIKRCIDTGRFEVAAQCYVAMQENEEAAKLLYKRLDLDSMGIALDLIKTTDNHELYKAIKSEYEELLMNTKNDVQERELPTRAELLLSTTETISNEHVALVETIEAIPSE